MVKLGLISFVFLIGMMAFSSAVSVPIDCEDFDIDNNAILNQIDLDLLNSFLGGNETKYCNSTNNATCDVNGDGVINSGDVDLINSNLNMTCDLQKRYSSDTEIMMDCLNGIKSLSECDIDGNGGVEPTDFAILINIINDMNTTYCTTDNFSKCDLNKDGKLDSRAIVFSDLQILMDCLNGLDNNYLCDVDGNGGAEPGDMSILVNALSGIETIFCNQSNFSKCDLNGNGILEPNFAGWILPPTNSSNSTENNETPVVTTTTTGGTGGGGGGCTYNVNFDWKCSDWGECINGTQNRTCQKYNNCGTTYGRPETMQECFSEIETNENIETLGLIQTILLPITGAVVGTLGNIGGAIVLGFIVIVLAGLGVVVFKRAEFRKVK